MIQLEILIIEDDYFFRQELKNKLACHGRIIEADTFEHARTCIDKRQFDVVIIDLDLGAELSGLKLLEAAKKRNFFSIVLTAYDSQDYIKRAYELGCDHYLTKFQFETIIENILQQRIAHLSDTINFFLKNGFVTQDEFLINEIKSLKYRSLSKPIFICGETGVGKSKIAEFIHKLNFGEHKSEKFISVNPAAIPHNLIESEFFGFVKGAFTGADKTTDGKIKLADNGTLFLDEITGMPLSTQQKLLKVLEEKTFYPIGATHCESSDFLLITATCDDIYKKIQKGFFRLDLFYRINAISLRIPPLRERRGDILPLIEYFLNQIPRKIYIEDEALEALRNCNWYGNVRELKFVMEKLVDNEKGIIGVKDIPRYIIENFEPAADVNAGLILKRHFDFIERHGLKAFIARIETEALQHAFQLNGKRPAKIKKYLKLSHSSYYRLYQRRRGDMQQNDIDAIS